MRDWWNKSLERLGIKKPVTEGGPVVEELPAIQIRIQKVRSEDPIGYMSIDLAKFGPDGLVLRGPEHAGRNIRVLISPLMRETCNRILREVESENDKLVFEQWVLEQPEAKF